MATTSKDFFTTEEVVGLLGLKPKDKWRIIKFVEGKEYGIQPAMVMGKGLGSRRLYDLDNICEIALALRFLEAGLRPAVVGEALDRLRKGETLSQKLLGRKEAQKRIAVVIAFQPKVGELLKYSRIRAAGFTDRLHDLFKELQAELQKEPGPSMLVITVGSTFKAIDKRLEQLRSE